MSQEIKVSYRKPTLAKRIIGWIGKNGVKPKALPILGGISIGDFFVPALPTQTSVILLAWLQPKRAALIVLTFAIAAALGALALVFITHSIDGYLTATIPHQDSGLYEHWLHLQGMVNRYGLWALLAMSMFPTPPRLLIILSLLSGMAWTWIVAAVFVGKLTWFGFVVTLVSKAPSFLLSLPWIGKKLQLILRR